MKTPSYVSLSYRLYGTPCHCFHFFKYEDIEQLWKLRNEIHKKCFHYAITVLFSEDN